MQKILKVIIRFTLTNANQIQILIMVIIMIYIPSHIFPTSGIVYSWDLETV